MAKKAAKKPPHKDGVFAVQNKPATLGGIEIPGLGQQTKYAVPAEAGIVATYVYERLKGGASLNDTLDDLRADLKAAVAFLSGVPKDATFGDLDLLSKGHWTPAARKVLEKTFFGDSV